MREEEAERVINNVIAALQIENIERDAVTAVNHMNNNNTKFKKLNTQNKPKIVRKKLEVWNNLAWVP